MTAIKADTINKIGVDVFMNRIKLKEAEEIFFLQYPGGFSNPLMLEIAKRHRVEKMIKLTQDSFKIEEFENPEKIVDSMYRIVSQSSLVSLFEKPKFKDLVKAMSDNEKERLSYGLKELLHNNQELGFQVMTRLLSEHKLAKWPLLTLCPAYYRPSEEVLVKPTTAKGIIKYFELDELKYSSSPTFEFYKSYREQINQLKKEVDKTLQIDNTAFCGFLMFSIEQA